MMRAFEFFIKTGLAILLSCAFLTRAALAEVTLHDDIRVNGPIVTLGDIFKGTGAYADTAVSEAPLPGKSRSVSVKDLMLTLKKNGLDWQRPPFLRSVRVSREGQVIGKRELGQLLHGLLAEQVDGNRFEVNMFGSAQRFYIPLENDISDIELGDLNFNAQSGRFSLQLALPLGDGSYKETVITGSIEAVRAMPVLKRAIAPGDIVTGDDIGWKDMPLRRLGRNYITSSDALTGKTVRTPQRAGQPLRLSDVVTPVTVRKNKTIGMRFTQGSIDLITVGRALENGGTGDIIRVMNISSKKTVQARIIGPDMVEIVTPQTLARQVANNNYR